MSDSVVDRAKFFAKEAHKGIIRPNKAQEPYFVHLEQVAMLVKESGGSPEEIAAGYLHDSVEDTSITLEDIFREFGKIVAEIVDGMTDPPDFKKMSLRDRKRQQAERVKKKGTSVKLVKLADQTSNVRSVAIDPPVKWSREKCLDYIQGARLIANQCCGINKYLDTKFDTAYYTAREIYQKQEYN